LFLFYISDECSEADDHVKLLELGMPDDVDVNVELNNWLFALEGSHEMEAERLTLNGIDISREERCWHTTFHSLFARARSSDTHNLDNQGKLSTPRKYPVEFITVSISSSFAGNPHYIYIAMSKA